jgi:hypothetical protein
MIRSTPPPSSLPARIPSPMPARPGSAGAWVWALGLLLLACSPARAAWFSVAGATDTVSVSPGQKFTLDLVVRDAGPAFNAFDLTLHFDPARLTNTPMSPLTAQRGPLMTSACATNSPFHLFTPSADSLVCTMVILCSGVSVTGPGTLYRVQFTASGADAWTALTFGPGTTFYNGGPRVDTLVKKPIVIRIGDPPVLNAGVPPTHAALAELDPVSPNPGHRPGAVEVSFRLPSADDAQVTLLDSLGRRVAGSPRARHEAGAQHLRLDLPRLAPGLYTLVLSTGAGEVRTRPWVVLR